MASNHQPMLYVHSGSKQYSGVGTVRLEHIHVAASMQLMTITFACSTGMKPCPQSAAHAAPNPCKAPVNISYGALPQTPHKERLRQSCFDTQQPRARTNRFAVQCKACNHDSVSNAQLPCIEHRLVDTFGKQSSFLLYVCVSSSPHDGGQ